VTAASLKREARADRRSIAAFFGSLSATYYAPGPRFLGRGVDGC